MKESVKQVTFLQLCTILMLSTGLLSHVVINPLILGVSGRDAWLVPLLAIIFLLPFGWLLIILMKRMRQEKLQVWLTRKAGAPLAWLMIIPLYIQIYLGGVVTTFMTGKWAVANYLPDAPNSFIVTFLILTSCYIAMYGIRAIAIGSGILLPTVIILGYFVMTANMPYKDYGLLLPIMEDGVRPLLEGLLYSCGCFAELIYLIPLQHYLKKRVKLWQMLILLLVFVHIMLGPLIGAITEFGPNEAAKQLLPPYEQWRLVHVGNYFEHVDFLALYQWLSGATIRIGLSVFLIADLIPARKPTTRKWAMIGIGTSYLLLTFIPLNLNTLYQWQKHLLLLTFIVFTAIVVLWIFISLFIKSEKEQPA